MNPGKPPTSLRRCALLTVTTLVAWSAACGGAVAARPPAALIVMYHHISPIVLPGPYARSLTATPTEFATQLAWLQQHDCKTMTVAVLVAAVQRGLDGCAVSLTFDDGYDDAVRFALPLLQRYHDQATFYVTSGYVGASGHVSRAGLGQLARAGMEIAAHTVHHLDLTTLSRSDANREIIDSRRTLQQLSGASVTSFAYPSGQTNASVTALVRRAGFANAVTTSPGVVSNHSDVYQLPRYRIVRGAGLQLLATLLAARQNVGTQADYDVALHRVAHERIAGNAPQIAEAVAVALLGRRFPEPIMKVHVLSIPAATVAGIVLSGTKFHKRVDRAQFRADVAAMAQMAFAAASQVGEVDIWATVPIAVPAGETVSGDLAVPTAKTVFSAVVIRQPGQGRDRLVWGTTFWDRAWLTQ